MKIDASSGAVVFSNGTIEPVMDKDAFLSSPLGSGSEKWHGHGVFEVFRFVPEPGIIATADFRSSRLSSVSLLFTLTDDSPEHVSRDQEFKRKEKHDTWLRAELGEPPYRYSWGQIVSAFYEQHCESDIMVIYDKQATLSATCQPVRGE